MNLRNTIQADLDAVPLHRAVLCINCECITNGLSDECLVCGSHSLFNLARLLGGTELSHKAYLSKKKERVVLFDAEITINLKQIEPKDLSATVEGIASLIAPSLGRSFHINVEPIVVRCHADAARAA
jgi:hypothetical protein